MWNGPPEGRAQRLIEQQSIAPVIIVGLYNTPARIEEYTWTPMVLDGKRQGGDGPKYAQFLVKEVKPFIDAEYRTRPEREHTGVGGSSMGGLISLSLCKWYPGVFGLCAAMSPALWWDGESFLRGIGSKPGWLNTCRVWLDMGGREGATRATQRAGVQRARRLAEALRGFGLERAGRLRYLEVPDASHNEHAWGTRFGEVLKFLFGMS